MSPNLLETLRVFYHMAQKVFSPFMLGGLHVAPDELNRPRFGVDFPRGFDGASKEVFGLLQMLVPRRPFHPTAISDPESPPDPLILCSHTIRSDSNIGTMHTARTAPDQVWGDWDCSALCSCGLTR